METIFYYLETGEIISKQELSSILNGFSVARGKIGIVNKNQAVKINEGKIENVTSIENISSIIPKELDVILVGDLVFRNNLISFVVKGLDLIDENVEKFGELRIKYASCSSKKRTKSSN